jgi:hypothetical protein
MTLRTVGIIGQHRRARVVQRRCVQEDAESAAGAGRGEDEEEEPIQNRGHVFPVTNLLQTTRHMLT